MERITATDGVHGLDLETGSAATVTGSLTASGNRVFGINVNGSSITFSQKVRHFIAGSGPLSRIRSRGARGIRAS